MSYIISVELFNIILKEVIIDILLLILAISEGYVKVYVD